MSRVIKIEQFLDQGYRPGFHTPLEADTVARGLNEDVVRLISAKKDEPEFLRECRRMIVEGAYRVGDFPRARAAVERLTADAAGEADRLRAVDLRARVDWAASQRSGPVAGDTP